MIQSFVEILENRKSEVFSMQNLCGKKEPSLVPIFFEKLGIDNDISQITYQGLFGWEEYKPDGHIRGPSKFSTADIIFEVKKISESTEYGYWHCFIQGLIYAKRHQLQGPPPDVLCIVLDWGRKSGIGLNQNEQNLSDYFKQDRIHTIRFSLSGNLFIEHNMMGSGNWQIISP